MSINTATTGGGDESSKRKREPNFNKWEDVTLCKCYTTLLVRTPLLETTSRGLSFGGRFMTSLPSYIHRPISLSNNMNM